MLSLSHLLVAVTLVFSQGQSQTLTQIQLQEDAQEMP